MGIPTLELSPGFTIAAIATLLVSLFGIAVAYLNYRRKAGIHIRGSFSTASSVDAEDDFVSGILLENLKDRAVTIFGVYLKIAHNYYIELLEFGNEPLILKPFESHQVKLGPIELYGFNGRRVRLNPLFRDKTIRKQLILSTSDGRYRVPARVPRWSPVGEHFKNHMTAILRPVAATYKGQSLGSNIDYVVEFSNVEGGSEIVPLRKSDTARRFRTFQLPPEALESKASLEAFLERQRAAGTLDCSALRVVDLTPWRKETESWYRETVHARPYNWFQYYVVGRIATMLSDRDLAKSNAEIAERAATNKLPRTGYTDIA